MITKERQKLYEKLESQIGHTPLIKYKGKVPNGNRIFIKMESENPFGSHYDRVYINLFRRFEQEGKIKPGDKIIETSSGSAGISFAGIGKALGYECYVALPRGGEKAREDAAKKYLLDEEHLILTPKEKYVNAFPQFIKEFLPQHKGYFFLNHSMWKKDKKTGLPTNNETTLKSLEGIATETINQIWMKKILGETQSQNIDFYIPAIGNGSSIVGPAKVFKRENGAKVVGFETIQSAVVYDKLHPGEYKKVFGIKPGTMKRHRVPGTSYQGIDFPHLRTSLDEKLLDESILISDKMLDKDLKRKRKENSMENLPKVIKFFYRLMPPFGKNLTKNVPHWDSIKYDTLGRTGNAGLAVALRLSKDVQNKNFIIIGYDSTKRYDK